MNKIYTSILALVGMTLAAVEADAQFYIYKGKDTVYSLEDGKPDFIAFGEVPVFTISCYPDTATKQLRDIYSAEYGETFKEPEAPTKEGYKFLGWYLGNEKYNFEMRAYNDISVYGQWEEKKDVSLEPIDLGLSIKWANMNVGATAPHESGDLFAWGETQPKETYTEDNYKYGKYGNFTKYTGNYAEFEVMTDSEDEIQLTPDDDAAEVNLGFPWRMPTLSEYEELIKNCYFVETKNYNGTGALGIIVYKAKNEDDKGVIGNSSGYDVNTDAHIFLPVSKESNWPEDTEYWTNTRVEDSESSAYYFTDGAVTDNPRFLGLSVRPVYDPHAYMLLNDNEVEKGMKVGDVKNIYVQIRGGSEKTWRVEDPSMLDIEVDGDKATLTAKKTGVAYITVETNIEALNTSGSYRFDISIFPEMNEDQAVDLGLTSGTKWSKLNLGAAEPAESGYYYYSWGELVPKEEFGKDHYSFFVPDSYYDLGSHLELRDKDDAAKAEWGDNWEIPSAEQVKELLDECYWEWSDEYEKYGMGYIVYKAKDEADKGKKNGTPAATYDAATDAHIFLPLNGRATGNDAVDEENYYFEDEGYYWTSSRPNEEGKANTLHFNQEKVNGIEVNDRFEGLQIRPVWVNE